MHIIQRHLQSFQASSSLKDNKDFYQNALFANFAFDCNGCNCNGKMCGKISPRRDGGW